MSGYDLFGQLMRPMIKAGFITHNHLLNQPRVRIILSNPQKDVLLVQHWGGSRKRWSLPGGGLKRGETPFQAASRELEEETGLIIPSSDFHSLATLHTEGYEAPIVSAFADEGVLATYRPNRRELTRSDWFDLDSLPPMSKLSVAAIDYLLHLRP